MPDHYSKQDIWCIQNKVNRISKGSAGVRCIQILPVSKGMNYDFQHTGKGSEGLKQ